MERRKIFRWIMIVINAVLISLLVYFFIFRWQQTSFYVASQRRVIFNERLGWRAQIKDKVNQLGHRGKNYEYNKDDFIIMLLGDSQVEAINHKVNEMPEDILQKIINKRNVKVFSICSGGYGNDQELIALQEYYEKGYRANLVILWFTPQNDPWNNIFPSHGVHGHGMKPTYKLVNGKLIGPKYYHDYEKYEKELPKSYKFLKYDPKMKYKGIIYRHPTCDENYDDFVTQRAHILPYMTPNSDRANYAYDLTNELILEILKISNKHNSKFFCFYNDFPSVWQYFVPAYTNGDGEYFIKPLGKVVKFTRKAYDENVAKCLKNIPNTSIMISTKNPFDNQNDRHLNNTGNKEVMKNLAKELYKRKLLDK